MAARAHNGTRGSILEQALAQLLLNQAQLVAQQAQLAIQHAMYEKESARLQKALDERFARIDATLLRHERILQELPEAIRKKIGYKQE